MGENNSTPERDVNPPVCVAGGQEARDSQGGDPKQEYIPHLSEGDDELELNDDEDFRNDEDDEHGPQKLSEQWYKSIQLNYESYLRNSQYMKGSAPNF